MTLEDVRVTPNIMTCMLQINSLLIYIYPGATHSFIANKIIKELRGKPCKTKKKFTIDTPLGESVDIDHVYKGIGLALKV
jgi:hypothetical protein